MTFAVISVHSPKPEHRDAVIDSMRRYSRVAREQPGLEWTGVVDDEGGRLVGIALWESAESAAAARPALMAEVGDDPFTTWDERPIESFRGPARWLTARPRRRRRRASRRPSCGTAGRRSGSAPP